MEYDSMEWDYWGKSLFFLYSGWDYTEKNMWFSSFGIKDYPVWPDKLSDITAIITKNTIFLNSWSNKTAILDKTWIIFSP